MADPALVNFLHMATSGNSVLSPEMWQYYGGDDLVKALQKYDPNAKVVTTSLGGGEGGDQGDGYRIDVDLSKLPKSSAGLAGFDLNPSNLHTNVINPNAVIDDPNYGSVTNSSNFYKEADPLWTKIAPLAVSMVAPMAGAALAGAGIGGAAGLTDAVTGAGLSGVNTANLPQWATQLLTRAPQTASSIVHGSWNPLSLLPTVGQAFGINPNITSGALTLANLARTQR